MGLAILPVIYAEAALNEPLNLRARYFHGQDIILSAMCDQPAAFIHAGVHLTKNRFGIVAVPADSDIAGERAGMPGPELDRHQATLRKTEQESLFWRMALSLRLVQNVSE